MINSIIIKKHHNIQVRTAHNTLLRVSLADSWTRVFAFSIDLLIVGIGVSLITSIAAGSNAIVVLIGTLCFSFYHLSFEIFNLGQSPGKKLLNIRVVTLEGRTPSLKNLIIRWSFRLIDIGMSLGSLGLLAILSSPRGQRMGDLMAGTTVIRVVGPPVPDLNSLIKLETRKTEIQYPELSMYKDEDMLIAKKVLERYKLNKTPENRAIMNKVYQGIIADTGIEPGKKISKEQFINDVITSYIIQTR